MTVTALVQLYAPLAGLLGVVFWLGVLSQKVSNLNEDVAELKRDHGEDGSFERLIRLETKMENVLAGQASANRSLAGVQRQLGNLATKGGLHEFGAER